MTFTRFRDRSDGYARGVKNLRSVLRRSFRQAVENGDVSAPRNIKVAINTNRPGSVTKAEATQHTTIDQQGGHRG